MGSPGVPESGTRNPEVPLTLQLAKESQLMITRLRELKLDDSSAPGMTVFGENGAQIAILHGRIAVQEISAPGQQPAAKEKHLVISPKGLFLAEGGSDVRPDDGDMVATLSAIRRTQEGPTNALIDEKNHCLRISEGSMSKSFTISRVDSAPEEFATLLISAVESSRRVAQKPLTEEIARIKAGNTMLDAMIQQEQERLFQPPASTGPTAA